MELLYHGSATAGLDAVEPRSTLHGSAVSVAYLTDSRPCALFYIWDSGHIGYGKKHVTGGIRNGTAFYEEQFPNQLETFYGGASGYLYHIPKTPSILPLDGREGLYYAPDKVIPDRAEYIPDVYQALLACQSQGTLEVRRYSQQTPGRQQELTELVAVMIAREGFCRDDPDRAAFLQRYFARAWETALKN